MSGAWSTSPSRKSWWPTEVSTLGPATGATCPAPASAFLLRPGSPPCHLLTGPRSLTSHPTDPTPRRDCHPRVPSLHGAGHPNGGCLLGAGHRPDAPAESRRSLPHRPRPRPGAGLSAHPRHHQGGHGEPGQARRLRRTGAGYHAFPCCVQPPEPAVSARDGWMDRWMDGRTDRRTKQVR